MRIPESLWALTKCMNILFVFMGVLLIFAYPFYKTGKAAGELSARLECEKGDSAK